MWRPWDYKKKPLPIHETPSPFSCSSFKDIQLLCTEDTSSPLSSAAAKRTAYIFQRVRLANSLLRSWAPARTVIRAGPNGKIPDSVLGRPICIPGADKRIVVYSTSLRVVRSTFEDCRSVRWILEGFRVWIDERDVWMDSRFLKELRGVLGQSKLNLPRVFIGERYMGGAEEIKQLHETGELKKLVEGLPRTCDICNQCDGSRKLYTFKTLRPVMRMVSSAALHALLRREYFKLQCSYCNCRYCLVGR